MRVRRVADQSGPNNVGGGLLRCNIALSQRNKGNTWVYRLRQCGETGKVRL